MPLRPRRIATTLAALIGLAGASHADSLRTRDAQGHTVDWTAGQIVARGVGVADRHSPSPATARPAARRRALADAARQLASAAALVPRDEKAEADKSGAAKPQLEALAADAVVLSADPLVDGSWRVSLALPLEALRLTVSGARALPAGAGDAASVPAVVIVRAPADTKPVLGLAISDGKTTVRGATLWATADLDEVPVPAPLLEAAPTLEAKRAGDGLRVAKLAGASDATLFVVVLGK